MQKIFQEVTSLDKRCYEKFHLTEDILMEHAANGMAQYIQKKFPKKSKVIIVVGSGNNGADGLALARLLHKEYKVKIFPLKEAKSPMALLQKQRCDTLGIQTISTLQKCDVLVDALVGTGFQGKFDDTISKTIQQINTLKAFKIACDVPSGYKIFANVTLTMGALKRDMFLDKHKEYVGKIKVINLGVTRKVYETQTNWYLLDQKDLKLPYRTQKDTHKGTYGHLALLSGEKSGATILSGLSALKFGAGLVTLITQNKEPSIPPILMQSHTLPKTTSALAIGMGLGKNQPFLQDFLANDYPLVIDADLFYQDIIQTLLQRKNVIITPHPKEFVSLLKIINLADITIQTLQENRFDYVELFCKTYPNVTLLLKGANVIIGQKEQFFINPHGTSALAKGGSGDVLSGLIGSLLAQGYSPLQSAINASLTHTKLAKKCKQNNFSLTPDNLILQLESL